MDTTLFLAQLWGWLLIIFSGVFLLRGKSMVNDMFAILDNRTLTFFAGMLSLILGLITVILHNYWTYDARMLITLFGWMAIAKGVVRIAFPDKLHKAISPLKKNKGLIRALLMTTAFAGVVLVAYSYLQQ